jgi:hypothetical protein
MFSTTSGCPRIFAISGATSRVTISPLPPAEYMLITLMGLVGKSCATAGAEAAVARHKIDRSNALNVFAIVFLLGKFGAVRAPRTLTIFP